MRYVYRFKNPGGPDKYFIETKKRKDDLELVGRFKNLNEVPEEIRDAIEQSDGFLEQTSGVGWPE